MTELHLLLHVFFNKEQPMRLLTWRLTHQPVTEYMDEDHLKLSSIFSTVRIPSIASCCNYNKLQLFKLNTSSCFKKSNR